MPNIEFTNSVSIPESFRMTPIGPPNVATPGKTTVGHCFSSGFSRAARILFSCVMTPVLSVCAQGQPGAPSTSPINFPSQPALELGERWNAESDKQATQIISTVEDLLKRRSVGDNYLRRDAHPKQHGCVKGIFQVDGSALPDELRVGLFAANIPHNFDAWVRFSNGNPDGAKSPDIEKDIRGIAIKLMNFKGATASGEDVGSLDLVMLTSKEFISEDANDYMQLHAALHSSPLSLAWHFAMHPRDFAVVMRGRKEAGNPLSLEYFSSVPYKLGPRSMKFKVKACRPDTVESDIPKKPSDNFLRERLVSTLKSGEACFDFFVQPNMEPDKNLVERANYPWPEEKSPYIKVAKISIPQQDGVESDQQNSFCENISFNPWRTVPEMRPLGQINRIRLLTYPVISRLRHTYNNVPVAEPTSHDPCNGPERALCKAPSH